MLSCRKTAIFLSAFYRSIFMGTSQCWRTGCGGMLKAFPEDGAKRQLASDIWQKSLPVCLVPVAGKNPWFNCLR